MEVKAPPLSEFHPDAQAIVLRIIAEVEKRRRKRLAQENAKNA